MASSPTRLARLELRIAIWLPDNDSIQTPPAAARIIAIPLRHAS